MYTCRLACDASVIVVDFAYVQNRIGTRLRTIRQEQKGKKLSDNKWETQIGLQEDNQISMFYGNVIRAHTNVKEIKDIVKHLLPLQVRKFVVIITFNTNTFVF